MKTLTLVLKRKWFDMIMEDEKKEEYREIREHYVSMLFNWHDSDYSLKEFTQKLVNESDSNLLWMYFKTFDSSITFAHGYKKNRDKINIEWVGIDIRKGHLEWGAEQGVNYFVFELGGII